MSISRILPFMVMTAGFQRPYCATAFDTGSIISLGAHLLPRLLCKPKSYLLKGKRARRRFSAEKMAKCIDTQSL